MDAAHFEKTLSSEVLFEGRVVTLTKDVALLENGETSIREVVHHHGGACIVPYFEDGTLCMVRQFRYAMQYLWPLLVTNQESMYTIVMGIQRMVNIPDAVPEWNLIMAVALLGMLPPLLVVLGMQKLFVRGLVETEK